MTVGQVLQKTQEFLKNQGFSTARLEAELLLSFVLECDRVALYLRSEKPLTENEKSKARNALRRRAAGEPMAYITGNKEFYGKKFFVEPGVLIPRPETEGIIDELLLSAPKELLTGRLADWGCGSGCLGLTGLIYLPGWSLVAIDFSDKALEIAKKNAKHFELEDRVYWIHEDVETWAKSTSEHYDCILANPPYVSKGEAVDQTVIDFEPSEAVFSACDGYAHLRRWIPLASERLSSKGVAIMEIGAGQGAELKIFSQTYFHSVQVKKDLAKRDRYLILSRAKTSV